MCNNSDASKIDYSAIFESVKNVLIGHCNVFDGVEKIDVPIFVVCRPHPMDGKWKLRFDECYIEHINDEDDDYVCFPEGWHHLKGEELCQAINEDYELYKASGKDKYLLKQSKPVIDDAVCCEIEFDDVYCALFKSKESAILAGKLAIFMDKYRKDKNKADWID